LAAVYLGYGAVTFWAAALTNWIALPLLAVLLAQHSSLQHEVLHGHPLRKQAHSDLTVFLAIGLFIPYARFKQLHRQHHCDLNLTDPYDDPETNFVDPVVWDKKGAVKRAVYRVNNTLLGRMIIGPALSLWIFYRGDVRQSVAGNRAVKRAWVLHIAGLAPVLIWLVAVSTMPVWIYLIAAYLGISLLKIRTFAEHRAHRLSAGRTVIIEDRGPLSLLFLNNNLHAVHHEFPRIAWYRLPRFYRARRQDFHRRNFGYCYRSYRDIFARHFLSAKDPVAHPLWKGAEVQEADNSQEIIVHAEPPDRRLAVMPPPNRKDIAGHSARV
jgi:fatty acid desaturase